MDDLVPPAALNAPTPDGVVDYERAYKVLAAALGREMIGSGVLYFVVMAVRDHAGEAAARELVDHMGMNRSKGVHDFMG